jgi:hypothetical protein
MSKSLKEFIKKIMDDCDMTASSSTLKFKTASGIIKQILEVYDTGNRVGYVFYLSKDKQVKSIAVDITILTQREKINEQ